MDEQKDVLVMPTKRIQAIVGSILEKMGLKHEDLSPEERKTIFSLKQAFNKNTIPDETAQKKLDEIVNKEIQALTPQDKMFLKARHSYLSREDQEKFKSVFQSLPIAPDVGEGSSNLADLKSRAEKVGLKYKVGLKKTEFLKQIEEAEKKL